MAGKGAPPKPIKRRTWNFPVKRQRFVEEYIKDFNATQAALRAGYSKASAYSTGAALLMDPVVSQKIQDALTERSKRCQIDADRVVLELAAIAFSDVSGLAEWNGQKVVLKDSQGLSPEVTKTIQSLDSSRGNVSVKLHDKLRALELLMRHLGILDPRRVGDASELLELVRTIQESRARLEGGCEESSTD